MNTPSTSTENVKEPLLTRGEVVGATLVAGAVGALAVASKMYPEFFQNAAEYALNLFGIGPLFENAVVTPQDGGPVMS